jgi:hypothetical protein
MEGRILEKLGEPKKKGPGKGPGKRRASALNVEQ